MPIVMVSLSALPANSALGLSLPPFLMLVPNPFLAKIREREDVLFSSPVLEIFSSECRSHHRRKLIRGTGKRWASEACDCFVLFSPDYNNVSGPSGRRLYDGLSESPQPKRRWGLFRSVTPFRAAFTLAINIPTGSVVRQTPASLRNWGRIGPAAPRSSKTPVM